MEAPTTKARATGIARRQSGRGAVGPVVATSPAATPWAIHVKSRIRSAAVCHRSSGSSCPALSFTVNGTNVMTNASTLFKDSRCNAIANGTRVEVKGRLQSGKVQATRVEIKKD